MDESLDGRQLKAFAVLAKTGSYIKTAKQLCVIRWAISHSLRSLEEQAGCRLLNKLGKTVMLAEAGETLLHHADRVLAETRQTRLKLTSSLPASPLRNSRPADRHLAAGSCK